MRDKKGFTLVELLIAMAIIALLIGLTVFGITAALRSARDTQRRNFVKDIQTGIADYQGQTRSLPQAICYQAGEIAIGQPSTACNPSTAEVVVPAPSAFTNITIQNNSTDPTSYSTDQAVICYRTINDYALSVYLETGDWEDFTSDIC